MSPEERAETEERIRHLKRSIAVLLFALAWLLTVPYMVWVILDPHALDPDPYGDKAMGLLLLTWLHAGAAIAAGVWCWKESNVHESAAGLVASTGDPTE